ncbi:MAG: fructosamine kinase family protein, partial [Anaerolineales bacterium]|nr:fructosamine kinase family protein [Anaerolineales bacterium]
MIPLVVTNWLVNNGFGDVVSTKTVGGGCVNKCLVITTSSYRTLFLKTNSQCPKDMFEREAEGLEELRIGKGPR